MGNWKSKMEKWFGTGPSGTKRTHTLMWLVLIALLGAALMIMNSFLSVKEVDPLTDRASPPAEITAPVTAKAKDNSAFREYEEVYEERLREILQKIVGVGDPEVMVTIESTEEVIVDKNTQDTQSVTNERDSNGASRTITENTRKNDSVLIQVSGNQQPHVLKYIKPKVRGVIVVAQGAENPAVKKMIIEAVERGVDVLAHRIAVWPRKQ
ncbi:stage III sporulation protein AG [Paenibacillus albiflavus]|uniref:Stage III sporulation protein AG n=1 Tax=Paenibacillus albiflavus TaxID=2545760 RepID=A0A4R4EGR6_9BACL|nr:stage III sporulation protein AG [Paenibacillus albiflavus]TCZ77451.1 stage III sporulation protein AG [Paenibacillus albiflavus]